MFKFKVMLVGLVVAVFAAGQVGVAQATLNCGGGSASKKVLKGTYTMTFSGTEYDEYDDYPLAASGSVHVDGNGNVTSGVIRCNIYGDEYIANITGGCYTVNSDYTGFMAISTASDVCDWESGVDLRLSISNVNGTQFQFSADGSDLNIDTGEYLPFTGTANKN